MRWRCCGLFKREEGRQCQPLSTQSSPPLGTIGNIINETTARPRLPQGKGQQGWGHTPDP